MNTKKNKFIKKWETSLEGKNVHSVFTKCFECGAMGCNLPQITECGNCGSQTTVRYYDSETINQNLEFIK
jgi:hypothetical protein